MKLGKIYDYRNKEEAKKLIGKKVMASDFLCSLEDTENDTPIGIFKGISSTKNHPFYVALPSVGYSAYQFIREIEEDKPKLMTNRQLSEWLAKGFGEWKSIDDKYVSSGWIYSDDHRNLPVKVEVRIRPWGSDEWVVPTLDIYERDCKGIRTIE